MEEKKPNAAQKRKMRNKPTRAKQLRKGFGGEHICLKGSFKSCLWWGIRYKSPLPSFSCFLPQSLIISYNQKDFCWFVSTDPKETLTLAFLLAQSLIMEMLNLGYSEHLGTVNFFSIHKSLPKSWTSPVTSEGTLLGQELSELWKHSEISYKAKLAPTLHVYNCLKHKANKEWYSEL